MAEHLIQDTTLTGIADMIRSLLGLTGTMTTDQMQTNLPTEQANIAAALAALTEKGVEVPTGANSNALAGLIAAIEAGGGPSDHMGYPVVTGEITFSSDVSSAYDLIFAEGNRLRVKTTSGFMNRPFFVLVPSSYLTSERGTIKYIVCPVYQAGTSIPTVCAFINASYTDDTSFNSTYMKFESLTWGVTEDSVNNKNGSDRVFTKVTLPCAANFKIGAGVTYRYLVAAPWGYPIDKVEVV